jgi:hypothetical protein
VNTSLPRVKSKLPCVGSIALGIVVLAGTPRACGPVPAQIEGVKNTSGLTLTVADKDSPRLRIVMPGRPATDTAIDILFPEHITAVKTGADVVERLYLSTAPRNIDFPHWRRVQNSVEYERDLQGDVHFLARATMEEDGIRFHYEFTNRSKVDFSMIYAVTDPRMLSIFHDVRLERTYVHHSNGFDLLASETPGRLTMPLDQWLPARYLVSYSWPVPQQRVERRDDRITYYNKSRAVDLPFIATVSTDRLWVVASFTSQVGNVWTNPELTCQHVDPQTSLAAGQKAVTEIKILVMRGSVEQAFQRAMSQRSSLK